MNNGRLLASWNKIKNHHFVRFFLILLVDRGFQLVSQLFTVSILTNYLGAGVFGVLAYALSIYGLLLSISNWGLERVLVVSIVASPREKLNDLVLTAFLLKLILSLALLVILFLAHPLLQQFVSGNVYNALVVLSIGCVCNAWIVLDALNQADGKFKRTAAARILATVLVILFRIIIVLNRLSFTWLLVSYIIEQLLCLVFIIILSKNINVFRWPSLLNFKFQPELVRSGLFVILSNICVILYMRASQGIVENKFSPVYLGVFSLAISFIEIPIALASVLSTIITPKISRDISSKNTRGSFVSHASASSLGIFVLAGTGSSGVLLFAGYILSAFLSPEYDTFYPTLFKGTIILPVIFLGYSFNMLLMTTQQYNKFLTITFVSAVVTIMVLYLMSKAVTQGTAIYLYVTSQVIASVVVPLLLSFELRSVLGILLKSVASGELFNDIKTFTSNRIAA